MAENIEQKILYLVATDKSEIPVSSFDGKLKRLRTKLASGIDLSDYDNDFSGERVFARVEESDEMRARGLREAINEFRREYPKYGKILEKLIKQKRNQREVHLYFGMQPESKLTREDYVKVMRDLGLSQHSAERLYPILMEISSGLQQKRKKTGKDVRSIIIG